MVPKASPFAFHFALVQRLRERVGWISVGDNNTYRAVSQVRAVLIEMEWSTLTEPLQLPSQYDTNVDI